MITELQEHAANNSKEYFAKMKKEFDKDLPAHKLAGILIYLNKTCFNGLFRVNSKSEFNVPYGYYDKPAIVDIDTLQACSEVLRKGERKIYQHSFIQTPVVKNAFYYLDPPYYQTYSSYDNSSFEDREHTELAELCHRIDKVGSHFVLSNSDSGFIRKLYAKYQFTTIDNQRSISCRGDGRQKQTELIISNVIRSAS